MSVEDLQKALDQFPKVEERTIPWGKKTTKTCVFPERESYEDWLKDFKEKFAVFRQEQEKQIQQKDNRIRTLNTNVKDLLRDWGKERKDQQTKVSVPVDLEKEAKTLFELQRMGQFTSNKEWQSLWVRLDVLRGKVMVDRKQLSDLNIQTEEYLKELGDEICDKCPPYKKVKELLSESSKETSSW